MATGYPRSDLERTPKGDDGTSEGRFLRLKGDLLGLSRGDCIVCRLCPCRRLLMGLCTGRVCRLHVGLLGALVLRDCGVKLSFGGVKGRDLLLEEVDGCLIRIVCHGIGSPVYETVTVKMPDAFHAIVKLALVLDTSAPKSR